MKQKERIISILCVFMLVFGLSSCTRHANEEDNTEQNLPATSAVEETAPVPVQNPHATPTIEATDPTPAQVKEDAGKAEVVSPAASSDTVLPELEVPAAPSGSDSGTQNSSGDGSQPASETPQAGDSGNTDSTAPEAEQPEPYDQGSEQGAGTGIVITGGGDIVLPELP